jgi:uncharacterized protein (TIGR01777 family)
VRIAVSGASGLVGSALMPSLAAEGHEVLRLVRRQPREPGEVFWDPDRGLLDADALEGVEGVVHLSGASIAGGRFTDERKALLRSSRVGPTRLLSETLARLAKRPRVLVSASALGYYGDRGDAWVVEADPPANDFLGRLSVEWEQACDPARKAGIRVVNPRFGIILSTAGGALRTMLPPFRLGVAGVLGPGTQYVSWIAIDDVVGAIRRLLVQETIGGPVNTASPHPVTNRELTKTLGRVLRRPTVARVPAFVLRLALGEAANALLASTRMSAEKLVGSGFRFRFPELEPALRHLLDPGEAPSHLPSRSRA